MMMVMMIRERGDTFFFWRYGPSTYSFSLSLLFQFRNPRSRRQFSLCTHTHTTLPEPLHTYFTFSSTGFSFFFLCEKGVLVSFPDSFAFSPLSLWCIIWSFWYISIIQKLVVLYFSLSLYSRQKQERGLAFEMSFLAWLTLKSQSQRIPCVVKEELEGIWKYCGMKLELRTCNCFVGFWHHRILVPAPYDVNL